MLSLTDQIVSPIGVKVSGYRALGSRIIERNNARLVEAGRRLKMGAWCFVIVRLARTLLHGGFVIVFW